MSYLEQLIYDSVLDRFTVEPTFNPNNTDWDVIFWVGETEGHMVVENPPWMIGRYMAAISAVLDGLGLDIPQN